MEANGLIGDKAGVMSKIEKPAALDDIDDIVRLSDAVMVARGDLGVEIPHEDVPGRQKELVRACRLASKPVVIATQMLDWFFVFLCAQLLEEVNDRIFSYAAASTLWRRRSNPARPYMDRLMTFNRLICPSTGPVLQGSLRAACTASRS